MKNQQVLGVDIGGTGIKGGIVDVDAGKMLTERFRLDTPQPATPAAVAATFKAVVNHFDWKGVVGVGFPAIIQQGIARSTSNIDQSWLGINIETLLSEEVPGNVYVLNDADAAGTAEQRFNRLENTNQGVLLMLTLGTGIGSALFINGQLVPNTELGHLFLRGQNKIAEKYASNAARKNKDLSWEEWGARLNEYLLHVKHLFSPDAIILGGGVSKHWEKYKAYITLDIPIEPAQMLNHAGTIGAAVHAAINQKIMV